MTPAELRSRIARSGISGKRLARLLGIPQPNVSGWCNGIRPIPAHHVSRIIEFTDNPPDRPYTNGEADRRPFEVAPGSKSSTASLNQLLKDFGDMLMRLAGASIDGAVPAVSLPIADVPPRQRPTAAPQPQVNQAPREAALVSMTGPLHADFIAEHNKAQQERSAPRRASGAIAEHAGATPVTHYCDGIPLSPDNVPLDRFLRR